MTLRDQLMSREKIDLVHIIEEMIILRPELEDIVEVAAGDISSSQLTDPQVIRRELKPCLEFSGEWMDQVAENKVYELTRLGSRFAQRGDNAQAIKIYCAILDECNAHDYPTDDEGQYVEAINSTVDHLKEAISQLDFAQHEALRQSALNTLVDTLVWDIEFGGIGYGYEAEDLILEMAQSVDIPRIREHVGIVADRERTEKSFSNWKTEAYESFLLKLDEIDSTDPEETLKRLQAKGLYYLYASKLLDLKRYEEAAEIISAKLQPSPQLQRGLDLLIEHQQNHAAIQLAEAALESDYDARIAKWLIDLHRQRDDEKSEFRWQLNRMRQDPHIDHYDSLSAVSESLDLWRVIRPQVISELKEKADYEMLALVYLHNEDWDLAWETLAKVSVPQGHHPSAFSYRLDFTVAEASREAKPALAIPIYVKYARAEIGRRNRKCYAAAAELLGETREMYRQMNDTASWQTLIDDLREEFARLPALQDELDKANL
ncbi:MAG: hypothetical protein OXG85_03680 [Chloroflexi bacterium]|nr:hypothetical protein [Chloroflexota bacterium]